MAAYSHILLAVDFTPVTDTVTRQAMELCQVFKARLSLVHVVEFTQMDLSNDLVLPQELEIDQERMKQSKQRLEELAENTRGRQIRMFCQSRQHPTRDSSPGQRTEHKSHCHR